MRGLLIRGGVEGRVVRQNGLPAQGEEHKLTRLHSRNAFKVAAQGGGKVALQARNGKYLTAGGTKLTLVGSSVGRAQRFKYVRFE